MELFVNTFVRALLAGNNAPQVEYEDAEQIDGNNYAIYYRQRPNTDSLTIKYTVTDADIISNAGQVKESYLYWDRDGDGVYTEGSQKSLLMAAYTAEDLILLHCGIQEACAAVI